MADPGKFIHRVFLFNPEMTDTPKADKIYDYHDDDLPIIPPGASIPTNGIPYGWEIRARISPVLGRELVVAKGIRADITLKLEAWYCSKLTQLTRIYWWKGTKWIRIDVASPITPDYQLREMSCYGVEINV